MAGVRQNPEKNGKYRAWYINRNGKQKQFTGVRSKAETLRIANKKEDEERQIRLGYRKVPSPIKKNSRRNFHEVYEEYMAWGTAQGGHKNNKWSPTHLRNTKTRLNVWKDELNIEILSDLYNTLPNVESALRRYKAEGPFGNPLAGKTLNAYGDTLKSFCHWCVKRKYLSENPLQNLERFPEDSTKIRAWQDWEIHTLLAKAAVHRRLLYAVDFCTGLRKNELTQLTGDNIDFETGEFSLNASWTKNREGGILPLPQKLLIELKVFYENNEAEKLYKRFYSFKGRKCKAPKNPLLYVPSHTSRDLGKDMSISGIEQENKDGKLVFHDLRKAYCTMIIEEGASVKEAQELSRHQTESVLVNSYLATRKERKREIVESVAERVFKNEHSLNAHSMQLDVKRPEWEDVSELQTNKLQPQKTVGGHAFDSRRLHQLFFAAIPC
jgi:integrase